MLLERLDSLLDSMNKIVVYFGLYEFRYEWYILFVDSNGIFLCPVYNRNRESDICYYGFDDVGDLFDTKVAIMIDVPI